MKPLKANSQCSRILSVLQSGQSLTVFDIHMMGINAATTRVMELRRRGHNIITQYENYTDTSGRPAQRCRYILKEGNSHE